MTKRTLTEAEWALVRAAYEAGRERVPDIAARHGLHPLTIRGRAWRQRWIDPKDEAENADAAPVVVAPGSGRSSSPDPKGADRKPDKSALLRRRRAGATAHDRATLIARLYRLIGQKLDRMEQDMASDDPDKTSDGERETRAIGTIAQSIERLAELETDRNRGTKQRDGDKRGAAGPLSAEETQRLSLELAERLAKLARRPPRE